MAVKSSSLLVLLIFNIICSTEAFQVKTLCDAPVPVRFPSWIVTKETCVSCTSSTAKHEEQVLQDQSNDHYSPDITNDEIRKLKPEERFQYRVGQLQNYKEKYGHFDVMRSDDLSLYNWIVTQRNEYRVYQTRGSRFTFLTKDRIDQLTNIGFDWQYPPQDSLPRTWVKWFELLKEYKEQHGHLDLPKSDNASLHKWMQNQRQAYRYWKTGQGRKGGMNEARFQKLQELGFLFQVRNARADNQWNKRYQELVDFKEEHGHLAVPQQTPLSKWMARQRAEYGDKLYYNASSLSSEREMRLRDIGFEFDGKQSYRKARWNKRFLELSQFYKEHNHTNVPASNKPLKDWVHLQRSQYRKLMAGTSTPMTNERVKALERIAFEWDARKASWTQHYEQLVQYYHINNNTDVPTVYPEDQAFSTWVSRQRLLYRRYETGEAPAVFTKDKIRLLDNLYFLKPSASSKRTYLSWHDMVERLGSFKSQYGHLDVPANYEDDADLGMWVTRQRRQYWRLQANKTSTLTPERIHELDSLDFEWKASQEVIWNSRLKELQEFYCQNGHFGLRAKDNPELARWLSYNRFQHRLFKQKKPCQISEERVKALDDIGFSDEKLSRWDIHWNQQFEELKRFHKLNGHFRVPKRHSPSLSTWVRRQRQLLHRKTREGAAESLSPYRQQLLEEIGFDFDTTARKKQTHHG